MAMDPPSDSRDDRIKQCMVQVSDALEKYLISLEDIWQEIGFSEKQKLRRNEKAFYHFNNLFDGMVAEEEELKSRTQKNVDECCQELSQLCEELGLPFLGVNENLSLLQKEAELRNKVDELNKEKHERLKELRKLRTEEQKLCDRLVLPQHEINFFGCPTQEQLKELEQNVKFLTAEFDKRFTLFKKLQKNIARYWEELELGPNGEIESEMMKETADDQFILSSANLKHLEGTDSELEARHKQLISEIDSVKEKVKALWNRLEVEPSEREQFLNKYPGSTPKVALAFKAEMLRLEELKKQHMQKFIESIRKELVDLWDKCYYDESQRREFPQAFDDVFTEDSLQAHEHQVQIMRNFYEENKEIYCLVQKREGIWEKKIEFENRPTDIYRLNNRGGALLKEEKMRKAIEKELPKLEHDLVKKIEKWESKNETYFLFHGTRYITYLQTQKEEYEEDKSKKKQQKLKEKENTLKEEMVFGSKPKTPQKRPHPGTPSKVNTKMRKVDVSITPSKFVHSSICPSPRMTPGTEVRLAKRPPKASGKLNRTASRRLSKSKSRRRSNRLAFKNLASSVLNRTQTKDNNKSSAGHSKKLTTKSELHPRQDESLVSYNEFAGGIGSPHCRSSFLTLETSKEQQV